MVTYRTVRYSVMLTKTVYKSAALKHSSYADFRWARLGSAQIRPAGCFGDAQLLLSGRLRC